MDAEYLDAPSIAPALRHPLLNAREERRLAALAAQGHAGAKQRLVRHNLRLVASVASSYAGGGVPVADLFQEGVLGLMRAADRYEVNRGTRFSTYAFWWIRASMRTALRLHRRRTRREAAVQWSTAPNDQLEDRASPPPEEQAWARLRREGIHRVLGTLSERERQILRLRFGLDDDVARTFEQVAEAMGSNRETVRLTERRLVAALSGSPEAQALRDRA